MLKKILLVLAGIVLCAVGAVSMFLYMNHVRSAEAEVFTAQVAELKMQLDAYGPKVPVFTVKAEVRPGTQLTEEMLQVMEMPESCINNDFITDKSQILGVVTTTDEEGNELPATGYYAKTAIAVGTPITKSLLMAEPLQNSLREVDIQVTHWPVGLTVGDYVDFRMTYPLGEEFIVLSHKRVNEINNQTLKVYLNENEMAIWQSALVEYYIYGADTSGKSVDFYAARYLEPGIQHAAIPFYSPSANIMNVVRVDHNIEGWERDRFPDDMHYDVQMRELQDMCLHPAAMNYDDGNGRIVSATEVPVASWPGLLSSGRMALIGLINSDYEEWKATHDYTGQPDLEGSGEQEVTGGSLIDTGGVN